MALILYDQVQSGGYYVINHDLRAFAGTKYQRGFGIGSVLKGFFKKVVPFAKTTHNDDAVPNRIPPPPTAIQPNQLATKESASNPHLAQ